MHDSTRPTQSLREEHVEIRKQLATLEAAVLRSVDASGEERRQLFARVLEYLENEIAPHASWEEGTLYAMVDRRATCSSEPFTATMRHEHRIVERAIAELVRDAETAASDPRPFVRHAERLFGLVYAHMECEEEVLLHVLDRTLTLEEFDREVGTYAEYR